jgi:hypothetical protein
MGRVPARLAIVLTLAAAVAMPPFTARGDDQKKAAPRAAPAARPAPPRPAAAPRPAAHPVVRAAPHPVVRAAPHPVVRAAPRPVVRSVPVHPVQRAATPRTALTRSAGRATGHVDRAARRDRATHRAARQSAPGATATRAAKQPPQSPAIRPAQQAQPALQTRRALARQQRRAERALRRQEDRALRNTPRSQRAAKREEIRRARAQRAAQRQFTAQPGAATTGLAPANRQTRAQRRSARLAARGIAPVTPQVARAGRFASRFAYRHAHADRRARFVAHRAWRHGHRAVFVAWFGPVFWPYAYSDIFDYAFWPYGYEEGYWNFAYDDFIDGVFWGEEGPPAEYASYSTPPSRPSYRAVQELCRQPGSGITAWPFADIERKVGLDDGQKKLLTDVRRAADDVAAVFKASCPADDAFPLTPPGRLLAMTARLQATLQAVRTVKPALEKFYASLSDEQKERFNELGPRNGVKNAEATAALPADAKSCGEPKPGLTNLPIERIGDAVDTTEAQDELLTKLQEATEKAVSILQAACPEDTPLTPPGRLEAMEKRLQAMIDAANTVKPALEDFYASLSNEQKARFNRMKETAQAGG